jgi:hypothetical protein
LLWDLVIPGSIVIPGSPGDLLRQRLQHRALAASQPCTGKCALMLQPAAAGEGLFRSPFFVYFAFKK